MKIDMKGFIMLDNKWYTDKEGDYKMRKYNAQSFVIYNLLMRHFSIRGTAIFNLEKIHDSLGITNKNTKAMTSVLENLCAMNNDDFIQIY